MIMIMIRVNIKKEGANNHKNEEIARCACFADKGEGEKYSSSGNKIEAADYSS